MHLAEGELQVLQLSLARSEVVCPVRIESSEALRHSLAVPQQPALAESLRTNRHLLLARLAVTYHFDVLDGGRVKEGCGRKELRLESPSRRKWRRLEPTSRLQTASGPSAFTQRPDAAAQPVDQHRLLRCAALNSLAYSLLKGRR